MKSLNRYFRGFKEYPKKFLKYNPFIIFLLAASLHSFQVSGQKCHYEKNEIDALTELVVKRTEPSMLARINGQPLYAKAQCIGANKYLKLVFYIFNDFSFHENREVSFMLSNKEEVILYPRQMPVDSSKMDDLTSVNSLLIYKLTDEQFQKLTQFPVIKFKYFVGTGFAEEDIKSSKQGIVMDVLRCVE